MIIMMRSIQLIDSGKITEVGVPNPLDVDELLNMLVFEASHADIVEHGEFAALKGSLSYNLTWVCVSVFKVFGTRRPRRG